MFYRKLHESTANRHLIIDTVNHWIIITCIEVISEYCNISAAVKSKQFLPTLPDVRSYKLGEWVVLMFEYRRFGTVNLPDSVAFPVSPAYH